MGQGGRRDDGGIGAIGDLFQICKRTAAKTSCDALVSIEDTRTVRVFGLLQNADVVPAENSGSHDRDSRLGH